MEKIKHKKFKRILILNRGEIACRIIQACQELQIEAVALCSESDKNARHTELADAVIYLEGTSAKETYLNLDVIIPLAKKMGCEAVHPGYGFLSERAHAAEAFTKAGLQWIGPTAENIRLLGDKLEAKKILQSHKIPTLPWAEAELQKTDKLHSSAKKIGFPLLLKAASGGGGKGMRLVQEEKELLAAAEAAAREASASFGDATLLLEKYLLNPRHIEVQILGDHYGNITHFGERECSIQRRHQKVIEEAPAIALSDRSRKKIWEAATQLAQAVSYANAGTIEFLVDAEENFYFLEMNSRLQVEHSVTELVWGIDLVKSQIHIAQGFSLNELFPNRDKIQANGCAIESRVYAEDPAKQFAPCPGILSFVEWPTGNNIRIDTGIKKDDSISLDYDAMIAKISVWSETRANAIQRMLWSLQHTILFGTITNINYLQDILNHPQYRKGNIHVKFLEKEFAHWKDTLPDSLDPKLLLQNTEDNLIHLSASHTGSYTRQEFPSPWDKK